MKLGIVGNGKIVQQALKSLKDTDIKVEALWCRNEMKGKPLVLEHHIDSFYTDYDSFLKDESFDTVYIGLINSLHYGYMKKAILAHKNVIVEKPFTTNEFEAKELYDLARDYDCYIFEAIMSRYSLNYEEIRKNLEQIGDIKLIQCNFSQYSSRYDAYLKGEVLPAFDPKLSGGALYDINVYNIHFVEGLFGRPKKINYIANIGFNGIDTSGTVTMKYDDYCATCTGAKDSSSKNYMMIQGTKGYIYVDSRPGVIKNVLLHLNDGTETMIDIHQEDDPMKQEFLRIQEVLDASNKEQMVTWLKDSVEVMDILTKCRKEIELVFQND